MLLKLCVWITSTIRWQNASWTERRAVHLRAKCRAATRALVIYLEYLGAPSVTCSARLVLGAMAASLAAEHGDEPGIEGCERSCAQRRRGGPVLPPPPEQFYRVSRSNRKPCPTAVYRHLDAELTKRYVRSLEL